MDKEYYYFNCKILKVIDGDTVDILVDLGFGTFTEQRFRLYGIDAPEKRGETLSAGKESQDMLDKLLNETFSTKLFTIQTFKDKTDKYGRYLCEILLPETDGEIFTVNEWMVAKGYAIERFW